MTGVQTCALPIYCYQWAARSDWEDKAVRGFITQRKEGDRAGVPLPAVGKANKLLNAFHNQDDCTFFHTKCSCVLFSLVSEGFIFCI